MEKLHASLFAKLAALAMVVALIAVCIASGILFLFMLKEGYYNTGVESYYDTPSAYNITNQYSDEAYWMWQKMLEHPDLYRAAYADDSNFGYTITDRYNISQAMGLDFTGYFSEEGNYRYMGDLEYEEITIRRYVREPITARDSYYQPYRMFQYLFPYRYKLIAVLAVGAVLLFLDLAFLLETAGRRRGVDGITLGFADKIPLDLYLPAAYFAAFFLVQFAYENMFYYSSVWRVILGGGLLLLACCVGLASLLSVATRYKAGRLWKNTLIYRLLRPLVYSLPLVWKFLLGYCAVTFLDLLLMMLVIWNRSYAALLLFLVFHLALFAGVGVFAMGLYNLKKAGQHLASGDLEYRIDTRWMVQDLLEHAGNLGSIRQGISAAVSQQMRSERLKTELITNVSHDIKTPLTSIINYVDLLGKQELAGEAGEYVQVLDRQTARLKKLTDDLVEASKATTGNLKVNLEYTELCEFANQTVGEYLERLGECHLEPVVNLPGEPVAVMADGRHLWRVMDNLLSNICKYAQPHTRVYVDVLRHGQEAAIVIKNISGAQLNINADDLMERFVRGDSSRATEGSGLGLHIARSLVELQGGQLHLTVDGDLFKVAITLPLTATRPEEDPQPEVACVAPEKIPQTI